MQLPGAIHGVPRRTIPRTAVNRKDVRSAIHQPDARARKLNQHHVAREVARRMHETLPGRGDPETCRVIISAEMHRRAFPPSRFHQFGRIRTACGVSIISSIRTPANGSSTSARSLTCSGATILGRVTTKFSGRRPPVRESSVSRNRKSVRVARARHSLNGLIRMPRNGGRLRRPFPKPLLLPRPELPRPLPHPIERQTHPQNRYENSRPAPGVTSPPREHAQCREVLPDQERIRETRASRSPPACERYRSETSAPRHRPYVLVAASKTRYRSARSSIARSIFDDALFYPDKKRYNVGRSDLALTSLR